MWGNVVLDSFYVDCVARGSYGESVRSLQEALIALNAAPNIESVYGADSDFGGHTEKDLKAFQKRWGIKADGVARKSTWAKLADEQNKTLELIDRGIQYVVSSKACPAGYNPATKTITPPGSPATKAEVVMRDRGLPAWVIPVSVLAGLGLLVTVIVGTTRKGRRK